MVKIIVEGSDDKNFLVTLLNDLKNSGDIIFSENVSSYILTMGGKSKLLDSTNGKYQKLSREIRVNGIRKIFFIFDCDFEKDDKNCGGYEKSLECFENLKRNLNWNIEIDYYIFDKNLDYFLLETLKNKECYDYFDNLVKCLDIELLKPNRKAIANLYKDLYPYPKFDFKDSKFDGLKSKLKKLFCD